MRQKNASMLGTLKGNHIPFRAGSLKLLFKPAGACPLLDCYRPNIASAQLRTVLLFRNAIT